MKKLTRAQSGKLGGKARTPAKLAAARANAQKAAAARRRQGNPEVKRIMAERGVTRQRAHQILRDLA